MFRNFWNLSAQDRLRQWKIFRSEWSQMSPLDCLTHCKSFWSTTPFVNKHLICDDVTSWPDPWQLIYENKYCDLAIALGIFYSLHLTDHDFDLKLIIGTMDGDQVNSVLVNDQYMLNLYHDEIVDKKDFVEKFQIKYVFQPSDLNLTNIKK